MHVKFNTSNWKPLLQRHSKLFQFSMQIWSSGHEFGLHFSTEEADRSELIITTKSISNLCNFQNKLTYNNKSQETDHWSGGTLVAEISNTLSLPLTMNEISLGLLVTAWTVWCRVKGRLMMQLINLILDPFSTFAWSTTPSLLIVVEKCWIWRKDRKTGESHQMKLYSIVQITVSTPAESLYSL